VPRPVRLDGIAERLPIDSSTSGYDLLSNAPRTFFDVPSVRDLGALDAQVAFLRVPFDAGTPQPGNRTGQTAGPAAARLSFSQQFEYGSAPDGGAEGWYDIETDREHLVGVTMADVGDVAIQGADDVRNFDRRRPQHRETSRLADWLSDGLSGPPERRKPCDLQGVREYRYRDSNPGFRHERAAS
jgi:hypothetical protein